jgi:hypothetical protein
VYARRGKPQGTRFRPSPHQIRALAPTHRGHRVGTKTLSGQHKGTPAQTVRTHKDTSRRHFLRCHRPATSQTNSRALTRDIPHPGRMVGPGRHTFREEATPGPSELQPGTPSGAMAALPAPIPAKNRVAAQRRKQLAAACTRPLAMHVRIPRSAPFSPTLPPATHRVRVPRAVRRQRLEISLADDTPIRPAAHISPQDAAPIPTDDLGPSSHDSRSPNPKLGDDALA